MEIELMNLSTLLLYPVFLTIMFILTLIFIPRHQYKQYLVYGFLIGGLGDAVVVTIMQNLLGVMWFKNQGLFSVMGHHALSPPSWTVTFMLFLYFLPKRRSFLYPYILTWSLYSVGYSYVVRNAELYDFRPWLMPYVGCFIFLGWWGFAAWLFQKTSSLVNEEDNKKA